VQVAQHAQQDQEAAAAVKSQAQGQHGQQARLVETSKRKLLTTRKVDPAPRASALHPHAQQQQQQAAAEKQDDIRHSFRLPVVDVMSACSKAAPDAAATGGDSTTTKPTTGSSSSRGEEEALQLLDGLREAVALLYNVTGQASCFTLDVEGPGAASVGE
jgi:hypothetical protein